MTSIQAGIAINNPNLRALDMSTLQLKSASEMPEELYRRFVGAQEKLLESRHSQTAGTSQNPAYEQLQKTKQARTLFLTQQIAQESPQATAPAEGQSTQSASGGSDAVNAFLEYMSKTPEERYYEALLAEEGLTKEQLAALPPDARAKIESKIQEKIKQHIENNMEGVA